MMKRSTTTILLAAALWSGGSSALAQEEEDLRGILPYLMIIVDTSGSMERLPACQCTTFACNECLPDCDLANDPDTGVPPPGKKNRWAVTLEALTGSIDDFQCETLARNDASTFDYDYVIPYHQPWVCPVSGTSCERLDTTPCSTDDDCLSSLGYERCDVEAGRCAALIQQTNGVLDRYTTLVQFGLMTFDGLDTYAGAPPLVPSTSFDEVLSGSESGLWSYGQSQTFHYPNCVTTYKMDTGARSAVAEQGQLISLNSCDDPDNCPAFCDGLCGPPGRPLGERPLEGSNRAVQDALIRARPYGGTPIAGALEDAYYHFKNDLADAFSACRGRYAMLITDGYPDNDYRDFGCDCANTGNPLDPDYWDRCGGTGCTSDPTSCANHPRLMHCPYDTPENIAYDLVHGRQASGVDDPPQIEKLFVIGLAIEDTAVIDRLNAIADNGNSETALFANDVDELVQGLSQLIPTPDPISRTVPVFANSRSGDVQYQISTGFRVPTQEDQPWAGIIERRDFYCDGDVLVEADAINLAPTHEDPGGPAKFNGAPATRLLTASLPAGETDPNIHMFFGSGGCNSSDCQVVELDTVTEPALYDLTDVDEVNALMQWMEGGSGTVREGRRLGDIYHSTPAIVGTPAFDAPDDAFNAFRASPVVTDRPLVMYMGSNDGILHAVAVEDYSLPAESSHLGTYKDNLVAGDEIWGFVPPMFLDEINDNLPDVHQFLLDGSPVVKDVYFQKDTDALASPAVYHTVLVVGMRSGGKGYVALDVTDPFEPKFLWQFTHEFMGHTYAQPAIAQVKFSKGGGDAVQRAVAILPGGMGTKGNSGLDGDCDGDPVNTTMMSGGQHFSTFQDFGATDGSADPRLPHRSGVQCWLDEGRALYFVDVEDGQLLATIHGPNNTKPFFPSPLVGTPAVYQSDIGTLASRAFLVDADGVIWRIDLSSENPSEWTARPFHDIFHESRPAEGELSFEAPVLSVDDEGRIVVIAASGDTRDFTKQGVRNRVVSLREVIDSRWTDPDTTLDPTDPERFKAALNWQRSGDETSTGLGLQESELVTGGMTLFDGQLFFASFIGINSGADACDLGRGRLHAVHYVDRDIDGIHSPIESLHSPISSATIYGPRHLGDVASTTEGQGVINVHHDNAIENLQIMGLSISQRPSCLLVEAPLEDVYGASIQPIEAIENAAIYLTAHAQANDSVDEALRRANSSLRSIELQLNRPTSVSRVTSWATTVD